MRKRREGRRERERENTNNHNDRIEESRGEKPRTTITGNLTFVEERKLDRLANSEWGQLDYN